MRRWLRCLVCMLVICALLVNLFPVKADATAAGAVGITKASVVTGNPYLIAGAALVTLGVYAASESGAFENLIDNAVSYLDSAGGWIENGTMQLLQTVTEAGQAAYYVAGDLLESLRSWLFDENVLSSPASSAPFSTSQTGTLWGSEYTFTSSEPFSLYVVEFATSADEKYPSFIAFGLGSSSIRYGNSYASGKGTCGDFSLYQFSWGAGYSASKYSAFTYAGKVILNSVSESVCLNYLLSNFNPDAIFTTQDLTLGNVSSVPIDGTSARSWAPDVADRNGLYVKYNNDPEPPDDNNGKWFWKLALPLTAASLLVMSQADEWSGQTPREFDDYSTNTEFEILDRPEIDGYQGIELSPVTNPDVNPDTGEGVDPTEPGEPTEPSEDESTGSDSETNWFEKIWRSIVELPNSFKTWFEDLKKGIEELPSKFSQWASDTISAIQNLPQAFANLFADVVAAIQSVPQTIKDFFTPKAPDNHDKFALADLSKFFPFCIPFDLYDFFTLLNADPVAPVLSWEIKDLAGQTYSLDVDLSQWDSVALLFRRLQLFLFITGLAAASRKFIKW